MVALFYDLRSEVTGTGLALTANSFSGCRLFSAACGVAELFALGSTDLSMFLEPVVSFSL